MDNIKILWADDEIDLFKPQMLFLKKKGYEVITVTNGHDALEEMENDKHVDIVFLDESMPGLTGLETLSRIKALQPSIPVVMITKNEAEDVMEEAIGSQITDYLIKPVNPSQILLTLKKIVDEKRLVREKTTSDYQQDFRQLLMQINSGLDKEEWVDMYKKIINWELKLDESNSDQMGRDPGRAEAGGQRRVLEVHRTQLPRLGGGEGRAHYEPQPDAREGLSACK